MIDNSSCLGAIETIKNHIADCFDRCNAKGSPFNGDRKLVNLESAINLIPTGEGTSGATIVGASFSGFPVTWAEEPDEEYYTISFGSYGTGWKSICCYSDSKDGHYTITKTSSNRCIISGAYLQDISNPYDESYGVFPIARGTFRATYVVSGSNITFTNYEYAGTSNGVTNYEGFKNIVNQVSNAVNDYYTNQYKLDKITVIY